MRDGALINTSIEAAFFESVILSLSDEIDARQPAPRRLRR